MDESQRLQLQKMVNANNVEDQTQLIRQLKHSFILHKEVNTFLLLKAKYRDEPERIHLEAIQECSFLFTYYTDIYNKIRKDEIDIGLLHTFLQVLREIEDGLLDQHEGSFKVGSLLKELYVDSALKKAEKLDKEGEKPVEPKKPLINVSWKEFKKINISF
jgi:hypothetical protein